MPNIPLLKALNELSAVLLSELDTKKLADKIVEKAGELTNAKYVALFYHEDMVESQRLSLVAVHGATDRQFAASRFPVPTPLLISHIEAGILRVGDITSHASYRAIKGDHLNIRSYMAVPISSRNGGHLGSLLFGHDAADIFEDMDEQYALGIASIAAVAMDNASLLRKAKREIAERIEAERALLDAIAQQKDLLDELNHRVKNTLASIQSIAIQTRNSLALRESENNIDLFYEQFEARLLSLSRSHDLLARDAWVGVSLDEAIMCAVSAVHDMGTRYELAGPPLMLSPNAAVTLTLVFHELSVNACRHGSMTHPNGGLAIDWTCHDGIITLIWKETGGPPVVAPAVGGFGMRLIERGAMRELGGAGKLLFEEDGLKCVMTIPLSQKVSLRS